MPKGDNNKKGLDNYRFLNRVGEKHITNEGYVVEIVECFNAHNCAIQFENKVIIKRLDYNNIMKGSIKNPFHKSVYGVGFSGIGKYSCKNYPKIHKTWTGMLERGYSEIHNTKAPTYKDCIADDAWHNFQNFAKWMEENFNSNYMSNWQLDKDILIKGNKIYSSETCCFVPKEINEIFKKSNFNKLCVKGVQKTKWGYIARCASQGVRVHLGTFDTPEEAFQAYKTAKEKHIKSVADKWKSLISDNVYQAMYNYEVEITD